MKAPFQIEPMGGGFDTNGDMFAGREMKFKLFRTLKFGSIRTFLFSMPLQHVLFVFIVCVNAESIIEHEALRQGIPAQDWDQIRLLLDQENWPIQQRTLLTPEPIVHNPVTKPNKDCALNGQCVSYVRDKKPPYHNRCSITHAFKQPEPYDNYVFFDQNSNGPRIKVTIEGGNYVVPQEFDVDWINLRDPEYMEKVLTFNSVGKYTVTYDAEDYIHHAGSCSVTASIISTSRPYSEASCPFLSQQHWQYFDYYDYKGYDEAIRNLMTFSTWFDGRTHDPCSNYESCDGWVVLSRGFGQQQFITHNTGSPGPLYKHLGSTFFQLNSQDRRTMQHWIRNNLLSEEPGHPEICTKCLFVAHQFREQVDMGHTCSGNGTQCLSGDHCHLYQCVRAEGADFFDAHVKVNKKFCSGSVAYSEMHKIYIKDDSYRINQLVEPYAITNNPRHLRGNGHDFVGFRYRLNNNGRWTNLASFIKETITSDSVLSVEAWSACGRLFSADFTFVLEAVGEGADTNSK